jgi:hypothetical protein
MMQHEEAELSAEITKQYDRYKVEDQTRVNGRLTDPLAQTFEQRMNRALESYGDLVRRAGKATILEPSEVA